MRNQFGQDIQVGDWVGYASRTGSTTIRKVGKVTGFGERETWHGTEATVYAHWALDGTWLSRTRPIDAAGKGVGITRLFKLDPNGIEP